MAHSTTIDNRSLFVTRRWAKLRAAALWLLGVALCVLVIGWVSSWSETQWFPVNAVRVEGEFKHLTRAQLHNAIAPHTAGGFFSVDVDAVRRAAQSVPWVASVTVRRVWPDGLYVSVVERKPVARWGEDALLTDDGQLFKPSRDSFPNALPVLNGPDGSAAAVLSELTALNTQLAPLHQGVVHLELDARRAWRADLSNNIALVLGRGESGARVQRYVRAYTAWLAPRVSDIERIDLRYTNGFAVHWRVAPKSEG